jgi:NADP-dependent 3-hydroxy acid dehydrogenase YdfG
MTDDSPLSGQTALVTGASSGIGNETARRLAREGAAVSLLARRKGKLDSLASTIESEFGVDTCVFPTDVTDEDGVADAVDRTVSELGGLDVLVNNAGVGTGPSTTVESYPSEDFRTVMETNVYGSFFATRAAIPHLRERSGTVVFVGSIAGQYSRPHAPVYAATKWWIRGFALSLAGSLGEDGIAVSVVSPAEVRTEFGAGLREHSQAERFDPVEVTEPEDVAGAIAYVAGQEPRNIVPELTLYHREKLSEF